MELISTGRLCHMTPAGSGTSPIIFRAMRLKRYPNGPLISAFGTRVSAMVILLSTVDVLVDMKTPVAPGL
jgi:hypothetical protein